MMVVMVMMMVRWPAMCQFDASGAPCHHISTLRYMWASKLVFVFMLPLNTPVVLSQCVLSAAVVNAAAVCCHGNVDRCKQLLPVMRDDQYITGRVCVCVCVWEGGGGVSGKRQHWLIISIPNSNWLNVHVFGSMRLSRYTVTSPSYPPDYYY